MLKNFDIPAELSNAVISTIVGIILENNVNIVRRSMKKQILMKTIRKREKFLISKYKDRFSLFHKINQDSFYRWLKEKETIKRILSFNNAEDTNNINTEQMRYCKELFFTDAFNKAGVYDLCEKEELRELLNDLFEYVDELLWKSLDEEAVAVYKKCVLEIRQSIGEFTENIIQEIHYHGSFAEYIDSRKVLQDVPFKLDYRSEKIPFAGRTEEFKKLDAFCASKRQISWLTITGKGGSGKSRLAYEYIKNKIHSADWKMCFLHDEFFKQTGGGGKYKLWHAWTYDKNLLLVVDCVQKYVNEVAEWINGLSDNNTITQKIRILILERTSEEEPVWCREVFDKINLDSMKYEEGILKLQPLGNDLISFAIKYAEKNKKQICEADAIEAWRKLKSIDSDERILHFIMILEAILNKKLWRNWNRNDLVDYIVRRELEDIDVRFQNTSNAVRSFYIALAFCTATGGLSVIEPSQDLPMIIKRELQEITNNIHSKKELCVCMQLKDGILQPFVPDIIGEFMVLYIIDQYLLSKGEKEEFIKDMWIYNPDTFYLFVYRLVQDQIVNEAYNDILQLMLFDAVPHDNIAVIENYSKLMSGLTHVDNPEQVSTYFKNLEQLYHDYPSNKVITLSYAKGLFNISGKQELPELLETIKELELLATESTDMQIIYAKGLLNLSSRQNLPDIQETVEKLEILSEEHAQNIDMQETYAQGLANLCLAQKLTEMPKTVEKLEFLAKRYTDNTNIQMTYAKGLDSLCMSQKLPEKQNTIEKLEQLALNNVDNAVIQTLYASELNNLLRKQELIEETIDIEKLKSTCRKNVIVKIECKKESGDQVPARAFPEIEKTMGKLEHLAIANINNINVQMHYMMGLSFLCHVLDSSECKEIINKMKDLAEKYADNMIIQAVYAQGLANLSHKQELAESEETIERLEIFAAEHEDNTEVQETYALGLANLSCKQQVFMSFKKTIRKLESLAAKHTNNVYMQEQYAKGLNNLCCRHIQDRPEIDKTIEKLAQMTEEYVGSAEIQAAYARGLVNVFDALSMSERKENVGKLECLAKEHANNMDIQTAYAYGLVNLSMHLNLPEINEVTAKLENLALRNAGNAMIQTSYAKGLFNLGYEQEMPEIKETIEKLAQLASKYFDNIDIQTIYVKALTDLNCKLDDSGQKEIKERLEHLIEKHQENTEILPEYVDFLFSDSGNNQELPKTDGNYE